MDKIRSKSSIMFNLAKIKPRFCRLLPSWRIWQSRGWKKPLAVLLLAVGLISCLSLVWPAQVQAATGAETQSFILSWVAYILEAIASLIVSILLWVIHFIIVLSGYNNFLNAPVVSLGWSLTRDVANMFYILVMLIIAFGTMFNLEQYSWKKLLPRLILTAILVNFSKTIIGLFIDFAQVIMLTFVNGYAAAAGGNFVQMFGLKNMFSVATGGPGLFEQISVGAFMGFLLGTVLLGVALVVTAVFAAILLIRIITLWILIVLAPLAFMLGTFPKGQEYYADWWKRLQNQIIVGPVIAFFLWLSLATMGGGNQYGQLTENNAVPGEIISAQNEANVGQKMEGAGAPTDIAKWENLGSFAVSIAMLFLALQMTQQLGVVGAGLASGAASWMKSKATAVAKKAAVPLALGVATGGVGTGLLAAGALKGGWFGAKKGAKYVGGGVWTKVRQKVYESPVGRIPIWFKEGSRRREEELKRAEAEAGAAKRMRYEQRHFGYTPDYVRLEKQKRSASAAKDFEKQFEDNAYAASTTSKAWIEKFQRGDLGHEGNDRHRGLTQLIFEAAYIDDMMDIDTPEMQKVRDTLLHDVDVKNADGTINEEETKKKRMTKSTENYRKLMVRGVVGNTSEVDNILWMSAEELAAKSPEEQAGIHKRLGDWSAKHQDELGVLADMKDTAKKTGHFENMGLASFDSAIGKYNISTVQGQADIINGNLVKMGLVEKAKVNPHSFMQLLGYDGNRADGLTELGKLTYDSWLTGMDETNLSRNLLGRTANVMAGFRPQDKVEQDVDEKEGGWVNLNEEYVDKHNEDLKKFFSNPLTMKGLYSKLTNIASGKIDLKKMKFVVGNQEATLQQVMDKRGDVKAALRPITAPETIDSVASVRQEKEIREGAPEIKKAIQRPEDLRGAGDEVVAAANELRQAVDQLPDIFKNLIERFKNLANANQLNDFFQAQSQERDTATGQPTDEARLAMLLASLVQSNERIKNLLLRILNNFGTRMPSAGPGGRPRRGPARGPGGAGGPITNEPLTPL